MESVAGKVPGSFLGDLKEAAYQGTIGRIPTREEAGAALKKAGLNAAKGVAAGAVAVGNWGAESIADLTGLDKSTVKLLAKAIPIGVVGYFVYAAVLTAAAEAITLAVVLGTAYIAVKHGYDIVANIVVRVRATKAYNAAFAAAHRNWYPPEAPRAGGAVQIGREVRAEQAPKQAEEEAVEEIREKPAAKELEGPKFRIPGKELAAKALQRAKGRIKQGAIGAGKTLLNGVRVAGDWSAGKIAKATGLKKETIKMLSQVIPAGVVGYFVYAAVITAAAEAITLAVMIGTAYIAVKYGYDIVANICIRVEAKKAYNEEFATAYREWYPPAQAAQAEAAV